MMVVMSGGGGDGDGDDGGDERRRVVTESSTSCTHTRHDNTSTVTIQTLFKVNTTNKKNNSGTAGVLTAGPSEWGGGIPTRQKATPFIGPVEPQGLLLTG